MRERFSVNVSFTLARSDPNLELYKRERRSHKMAIHGQELVEATLGAEKVEALNALRAVTLHDMHVEERVAAVLAKYDATQVLELSGLFFDKPGERSAFKWFCKVMEGAFHLTVFRGSRERSRAAYHTVRVCPAEVERLAFKYRPPFLVGAEAAEVAEALGRVSVA
jgi:hypothetical protein